MNVPKIRFKPDVGGAYPEWVSKSLKEVCKKIKDGTHFSPKSKSGPRKYITSKNIRNSGLDLSSCSYISEDEHREIYRRCSAALGDVLLTKDGAGTGNCCLNTLAEEFSLLSSVAVLSGEAGILSNEFLLQILQSKSGQNTISNVIAGQAITRITLDKINKFTFMLPHYEEQKKIALFLSLIDKKISLLTEECHSLSEYKKGVMQKIFNQEIRFKDSAGKDFPGWEYVPLEEVLDYEQPGRYLVSSTEYSDDFNTPVLTAGKTFLLGYTDEINGIFTDLPVIIFDDFTTAFKFVDFPFKAKSSAMKMLKNINSDNYLRYIYEAMCRIDFQGGDEHKRYWISQYSKITIPLPHHDEQIKILEFSAGIDKKIEIIKSKLELTKQYKQGLLQQMFI